MIKYSLIAISIFALSACSSKNSQGEGGVVGTVIKGQLTSIIAARKAAKSGEKPAAPKPLTMADVSKSQAKLIRIQVPKYKSASVAQLVANNRGYKTYFTSAKQSVTLKGGQLTATRGLRNDLMARSVGGQKRTYKYLDHLNHGRRLTVNCSSKSVGVEDVKILDRTYKLSKIEEICRNETRAFKNVSWVNGSGSVRKAYQWAGDELGFVIVEWLN